MPTHASELSADDHFWKACFDISKLGKVSLLPFQIETPTAASGRQIALIQHLPPCLFIGFMIQEILIVKAIRQENKSKAQQDLMDVGCDGEKVFKNDT